MVFSRDVLKLVANLLLLDAFNQGLLIVIAFGTILYLGVDYFGVVQYFTAVGAFPGAFYNHFTLTIRRFAPVDDTRLQAEIFLSSLLFQVAIAFGVVSLAFLGFSIFPATRFWRIEHSLTDPQVAWNVAIVLLSLLTSVLANSLRALVNAQQKIRTAKLMATFEIVLNLTWLLAAFLLLSDRAWGCVFVLGSRVVSQVFVVVLSLVYLSHISDVWSQLARIGPYEWIPVCRQVHQDLNRRYTLPLQLASVFAFLKEHLAVIVLGQAASVTQVAYYQVVNRIFVVPRKFILSTMHALLPKIVGAMEADPAHFRKQFRFFAWVQLAFCVAAASAILVLQRPIFGLLGIEPTAEVAMVVLFFSIDLLFSALSQSNSLGFHFGSDTRAVMVVSILQASILTVLTMLLVPHAQAVGGAIALMVATACSSVMLVIANRHGVLWQLRDNLHYLLAMLLVATLWYAGI